MTSSTDFDQWARFRWTTFDVSDLLPAGWAPEIESVARESVKHRVLIAGSVTSREETPATAVHVSGVWGRTVEARLPWLASLYRGAFRRLAESAFQVTVRPARDDRYGAVLNIQLGHTMRYECHVDSNPIEALLYVTTHVPGDGGELIVGRSASAHSVAEIESDHDTVYPISGQLVMFDGRRHPHYVRPLTTDGLRIVVAMNYYTDFSPEQARPLDLNRHLFGED